jgi:membrane-associated two-gene conflict system component 1 (EACC1)
MTDYSEGAVRSVNALLTADGPAASETLSSLAAWLRSEDELRGRVRFASHTVDPDRMSGGTLLDVLAIAVGAGGALSVLANSLSVWLRQPRRANVRIQLCKPDGTTVEITGEHLRTPAELENLLRTSLHPMPDDSRPAEQTATDVGRTE